MFLNNQQVAEDIKSEIKTFLETNDNENKKTQNQWDAPKSSSKREVYRNTILPQEKRKISNGQPNFTHKTTGKRRTKKPKISRRKEIIKI